MEQAICLGEVLKEKYYTQDGCRKVQQEVYNHYHISINVGDRVSYAYIGAQDIAVKNSGQANIININTTQDYWLKPRILQVIHCIQYVQHSSVAYVLLYAQVLAIQKQARVMRYAIEHQSGLYLYSRPRPHLPPQVLYYILIVRVSSTKLLYLISQSWQPGYQRQGCIEPEYQAV